MIGCFDSKAEEFSYLHTCLHKIGLQPITINTGIFDSPVDFAIDYSAEEVAGAAGASLDDLRTSGDRGAAVEKMGIGAYRLITNLLTTQVISGGIGMGGGGGTYITLSAMQAIPLGIPKVCLSTIATKDLSRQIGNKDMTLIPSIVDIAGLNHISRLLISQAAGALSGMISCSDVVPSETTGSIAISIFGNTTPCVDKCARILKSKGYEVLTFHAVGVGGEAMESLIREGAFDAVLDITTTELADHLCEGICSAGPERLTAASDMGIPQVVVPGCLDMVNYGQVDTVPERFKDRLLYSWAPDVTLMRTNEEENRTLGKSLALKVNRSKGPATILLPLKGISQVSSEGGVFYKPEIDRILFDTIKHHVQDHIAIHEIDASINDDAFAEQAVEKLLALINKR
ncbi:UNVERIFIED_CONTAM: hypothetical protein GTU68_038070 [Idotea baltica]|nr:hypothetical protein [Idotea baltica]